MKMRCRCTCLLVLSAREAGVGMPFNVRDYLDLVDWTGRFVRADKRGAIGAAEPRLLSMLGIVPGDWLPTVTEFQARFELVVGAPRRLRSLAARLGRSFFRGYGSAVRLYRMAVV